MKNTLKNAFFSIALPALVILVSGSSSTGGEPLNWIRKAEETRAKMSKVAEAIELRVKDYDPSKYDQIRADIDAALETVRSELDALREASSQLERGTYADARTALYDARSELYDARSSLYEARNEGRRIQSEQRAREQQEKERAKQQLAAELRDLERASLEPGSTVVALVATELKSGNETVGLVKKGETLAVERVQGDWLFVRNGWVYGKYVASDALTDWYRRLADNSSIENAGRVRAKLRGILLDIDGAGSKGSTVAFNVNYAAPCTAVFFAKVMVFLEKRRDGQWDLHLNFNHSGRLVGSPPFPTSFKGRRYGIVTEADYVQISVPARQMSVNGQFRRPQ